MERALLGQILISLSLLSEEQLAECLELQKSQKPRRPLGEILLEQGIIDERSLSFILNQQGRRARVPRPVEARQPPEVRPPPPPKEVPATEEEWRRRLTDGSLRDYLLYARKLGASDLILSMGQPVAVRLHGVVQQLPFETPSPDSVARLFLSHLSHQQLRAYEDTGQADLALEFPETGRVRLNVFRHSRGTGALCRLISDQVWEFNDLGLPQHVREFSKFSNGLVLVTGVTGSGKTTTLNALIHMINQAEAQHIITIEEPVEARHQNRNSFLSQREIPTHSHSFQAALRSALREDPDVIVIGEIRDPETAATAIAAAETGHLVFGTLHTRNSYRTILRLLDMFPAERREHVRALLSHVLRAVVCQQLVPWSDGNGLSLAYEIMVMNAAIANLIRKDKIFQIPSAMQTAREQGMNLMDDSLLELACRGRISLDEAMSRASEKEKFLSLTKDQTWRKSINSSTK